MIHAAWLFVVALVIPALWGLAVHSVFARLWPADRRATSAAMQPNADRTGPSFFDYQI